MDPEALVVLASQSPYRRELLGRLLPRFRTAPAQVDETPLPGEPPRQLAERLARQKARTCAEQNPTSIVIGSDQVAALGERPLGKPGTSELAVAQLLQCRGQSVTFFTAVCVLGPAGPGELRHTDQTRVQFRSFTEDEARRYVAADQPLDCAGSFKAEKRGVVLLDRIDNCDPTGIQGLPLIWLSAALRKFGVGIV
jgi:septum formation protein